MFSYEICKIFKHTFFYKTLPVAVSIYYYYQTILGYLPSKSISFFKQWKMKLTEVASMRNSKNWDWI